MESLTNPSCLARRAEAWADCCLSMASNGVRTDPRVDGKGDGEREEAEDVDPMTDDLVSMGGD